MATIRSFILSTIFVFLLEQHFSLCYGNVNNETDSDLVNSENEENKRPTSEDDYGISLGYMRDKRKPKPTDRNMISILRRFNQEQKRQEDLIAADANPRMEPNYTGVARQHTNFGGIINEQSYNRQNDKIRKLFRQQKNEKEAIVENDGWNCDFESECKWTWRKDIANGFFITSPDKYEANETGPSVDANQKSYGEFIIKYYLNRMLFILESWK